MRLLCCLILNWTQLVKHIKSTSLEHNSQCVLCKLEEGIIFRAKMRAVVNCSFLILLVILLVVNGTAALFWSPSNICEQNPAPACESGEYLQSQFIASTNGNETMNCSPYSTFERKLWFDCVVSF